MEVLNFVLILHHGGSSCQRKEKTILYIYILFQLLAGLVEAAKKNSDINVRKI